MLKIIVGLFGFCWEREIFSRLFWKCFIPVLIIWKILYGYFIPELDKIAQINPPQWYESTDLAITWCLNILWLIALYLYAFRRQELWE